MSEIRVGISGWRYGPWRGTFYPEGLAQRRELEYASRQLNSIEINGTFYSLQRPSSWRTWHEQTPEDFVFSVKGSQYITHIKRLRGIEEPLASFFAQGILALGEKLGPILWQFPPSFRFDGKLVEAFLEQLPHNFAAAAKIAKGAGEWMEGRSFVPEEKGADGKRRIRHAMEIRHESFRNEEFIAMLRRHDVALVVADTAGKWPLLEDLTSDFVYVRLHGDEQIYVSGYTPEALDRWAGRVRAWLRGTEAADAVHASKKGARKRKSRDVYVYFDNDLKVRAPVDARGLAERLGAEKLNRR